MSETEIDYAALEIARANLEREPHSGFRNAMLLDYHTMLNDAAPALIGAAKERDELLADRDAANEVFNAQSATNAKFRSLLAKAGDALEPYGPSLKSVKLLLAEIKDALSPIAAVQKEGT